MSASARRRSVWSPITTCSSCWSRPVPAICIARATPRLGRTVAVRLLPADFTADRAALIQQARGLTSLSHPNVTTLFDVGEHDGRVYFVFEFQKGQSLRAEAAGGR